MKRKLIALTLLFGLFCSRGAFARQFSGYFITTNSTPSNPLFLNQGVTNLLNLLNKTGKPLYPYKIILASDYQKSEPPTSEPELLNESTSELMLLLNSQMSNLLSLETQWQALEAQSLRLSQTNKELTTLLAESKETIKLLRTNLEIAVERIQDAESGAIALLEENEEIYAQAKNIITKVTLLENQLNKARRGSVISFCAGAVSFGAGVPVMINGIEQNNSSTVWTGVGIFGVCTVIWSVGHFVFGAW